MEVGSRTAHFARKMFITMRKISPNKFVPIDGASTCRKITINHGTVVCQAKLHDLTI